MTMSDDDLREIWRDGSTDIRSDRSGCLTDVEWARLLSKEADEAERVRAADHIGSCSACADEYHLLLPLQTWRAEVEQVFSRGGVAQPAPSTGWRAWLLSVPRPAIAFATAAVLFAMQAVPIYLLIKSRRENTQLETQLAGDKATVIAAIQEEVRRQAPAPTAQSVPVNAAQQRLAELSSPQLGVAIIDLDPRDGGSVRSSAAPHGVTIDPSASFVTLILNFAPLTSRSTLKVQVNGQGGQLRWVGHADRDRSTASLTLTLPIDNYPAGRYDIHVFDVTRATHLGTYQVIIRPPSAKGR